MIQKYQEKIAGEIANDTVLQISNQQQQHKKKYKKKKSKRNHQGQDNNKELEKISFQMESNVSDPIDALSTDTTNNSKTTMSGYCHEPEIVAIVNNLEQTEIDDGFVLVTKKKQKPSQPKTKENNFKQKKPHIKIQISLEQKDQEQEQQQRETETIETQETKQQLETNDMSNSEAVDINALTESIFEYKLTNDFQQKVNKLIMDSNRLSPLRMIAIQRLQFIITQIDPQFKLSFFGSTVTGLSLPRSDIDINIIDPTGIYDPIQILEILLEELNHVKWINYATGIFTASVPVLKLKVIPLEPFTSSCSFLNLPQHTQDLYSSEYIEINIDVTMQSMCQHFNYQFIQQPKHMGELSTELVNMWLALYPPLFALTIFFKDILYENQFNCTYKGGFSSYSLVILIIAFLRSKGIGNSINYSQIVMQFCQFFGKEFNPKEFGICLSCEKQAFYGVQCIQSPFFQFNQTQPMISDPPKLCLLDPLNESSNLTKNSYKTLEILKKFSDLHSNLLSYKSELKELLESLNLQKSSIETAQTQQQLIQLLITKYQQFGVFNQKNIIEIISQSKYNQ